MTTFKGVFTSKYSPDQIKLMFLVDETICSPFSVSHLGSIRNPDVSHLRSFLVQLVGLGPDQCVVTLNSSPARPAWNPFEMLGFPEKCTSRPQNQIRISSLGAASRVEGNFLVTGQYLSVAYCFTVMTMLLFDRDLHEPHYHWDEPCFGCLQCCGVGVNFLDTTKCYFSLCTRGGCTKQRLFTAVEWVNWDKWHFQSVAG